MARIAARLDGRTFTEPAVAKRGGNTQLRGSLISGTVIPRGQRCSQVVRRWMTEQIGQESHFDAAMRAFFAQSDGTQTMQDAANHWYATRGQVPRDIDSQFEYNQFTRAWHEDHPGGDRAALLAAWLDYRNKPVDERGRA